MSNSIIIRGLPGRGKTTPALDMLGDYCKTTRLMESLGKEFEQVLFDNLWELYEVEEDEN